MARQALEVADIFRDAGPAFRQTHAGHLSLGQLKAMSAIERCRSAALGGHVRHCDACGRSDIAYNSCRDRHCPKCQGAAAQRWLAAREAELLPVAYFHVVFTVPGAIGDIAYQNKAAVYDLLFKVAAETLLTIGADPKRLGARLGITAVLHTWGSAMTHHPHLVASRPHFFLPVRVLSRLFRRRFLERLGALHADSQLAFFGKLQPLHDPTAFAAFIAPLRKTDWVVDARAPFAGPAAVLAYLSRYTHRVAIANSRLIDYDGARVTFRWKDYRAHEHNRYKTMALDAAEFIRRFLIHTLPRGFHRIRHYGLFANARREMNLQRARQLLEIDAEPDDDCDDELEAGSPLWLRCPTCGASMRVIDTFHPPRAPPARGRDPP
jgi:hypothetical protein